MRIRTMRSIAPWRYTTLSQVMSPSSSTTTTSQRPLKFSSRSPPATAGPRTCMTRRSVTMLSAERSSPLFIHQREEPANLRQAYQSQEESLLPAQPFFAHTSTGRRMRTQFVSKTKVKPRNGKRKNQDSP